MRRSPPPGYRPPWSRQGNKTKSAGKQDKIGRETRQNRQENKIKSAGKLAKNFYILTQRHQKNQQSFESNLSRIVDLLFEPLVGFELE